VADTATVGFLRVILTGDSREYDAMMRSASAQATRVSKDLKSFGQSAKEVGTTLTTAITLPLVGLAAGAAKAAIDFESSFAGIRKTVDGTEQDFAALAQGMRDLSKEIPVNVNELNRIGEAAGALGIQKGAIVDFTKVMAQLGVTTNLTSDQAADGVARVQNIFNSAGKDTDRFGATLVALGNAGASTEAEILDLSKRLAGAAAQIGITQAETLGFASALASVGVEAEAGGTAFSRVFIKMASAARTGGKELEAFAKVADVSTSQFRQQFETDAAGAVVAFVQGLDRMKRSGEDVFGMLGTLELSEIRVRDALLRTSGASEMVRTQLDLASRAWEENTALTREAEERFKTTESQLILLWNRLKDVGVTIGNALLPAINQAIDLTEKLIPAIEALGTWFANLPQPIQMTVLGVGALAAAAGPALVIIGQMSLGLAALAGAFGKAGFATKGFGLILAGGAGSVVAGATAGTIAFGALERATDDAADAFKEGEASWGNFGAALLNAISRGLSPFAAAIDDITQAFKEAKNAWDHFRGTPVELPKIAGQETRKGKDIDLSGPMAKMLPEVLKVNTVLKEQDQIYETLARQAKATADVTEEEVVAAMKKAAAAADALNAAQDRLVDTMRDAGIMTQEVVSKSLAPLIEKLNLAANQGVDQLRLTLILLEPEFTKIATAMRNAGQDAGFITDMLEDLKRTAGSLPPVFQVSFQNLSNIVRNEFGDSTEIVRQSLEGLPKLAADNIGSLADAYKTLGITSRAELQRMADDAGRAYQRIAAALGKTSPEAIEAFKKWQEASALAAGKVGRDWTETFAGIRDAMMAFADTSISFAERAARAAVGIFGSVADVIMEKLGTLGDKISKSLAGMFGETGLGGMLGGMLGNLISGGISAIAGWAINKAAEWISNLIYKPSMRANDDRDVAMTDIAARYGGTGLSGTGAGTDFAIVAAKLHEATGSNALFEKFLKADTPEKFAAALREVEAALAAYEKRLETAKQAEQEQAAAIDETRKAHEDKIASLREEMKSLDDEIAHWDATEAPEEVMGVMERQARDRIAAEKARVQAAIDEQQRLMNEALGNIADAGAGAAEGLRHPFFDAFEAIRQEAERTGRTLADMLNDYESRLREVQALGQPSPSLPPIPGFTFGTPNLDFLNFGPRGKLAVLHNEEAVVPKRRVGEFVEKHAGGGDSIVTVVVLPHGGTVRDVMNALPQKAKRNEGQFGAQMAAALAPYGVR
jgi:TP901 family phage tail tape measure protein